MVEKVIVGITMGDAAGVGPEIIIKALADEEVYQNCNLLVIGDAKRLEQAIEIIGADLQVVKVKKPEEAKYEYGKIDCLDMDLLPEDLPFGVVNAKAGDAAFRYVERAIELAKNREIDVICTAPLNKEAMHLGGHNYPGHTEILADLTDTEHFAMMFHSEDLNVILVTIHVGLIESIELVTPESVYNTISIANDAMKKLVRDRKPRIVVCGINPHAGENGMFGNREEETKIVPAVTRALEEGMDVTGPLPADTAFYLAKRGDYDIVVAMYHDQGLGPVKVLGIDKSVNITVGLPFLRTSVDHGTAFNIAGTGVADASGMKEAIKQAWLMGGH